MFYVCDKIGDKYGVVDTNDSICEYYSEEQLRFIQKSGVVIYGVSDDCISIADTNFIRAKAKMLGIKLRNQIYYTLP